MSKALKAFSETIEPEISIQVVGHRWNIKAVVSWNGIIHEAISPCLAPKGSLPNSKQYKDALDKGTKSAQLGLYNRIMVFYADILEARNNYETVQDDEPISTQVMVSPQAKARLISEHGLNESHFIKDSEGE